MHNETRRLIEDCLPLDIISERAAREKSQRAGNLSSLHIWWGRKPQIAARAALYAALVPAPHDQTQRTAYLEQLIALCTTDIPPDVLRKARRQIADVHRDSCDDADGVPLVIDLFAGGGSIPLEALRLGCTTLSSDLNPVAYLIELCTLVYPQRYPDMAELVATWGKRLLTEVQAAVAHLYPPLPTANTNPLLPSHTTIPTAYIWTRIVTCPNPRCGATVPLTQNTWLVKRPKQAVALRIVPDATNQGVRFTLAHAASPAAFDFNPEGLSSRGNATCFCCGSTVESSHVKQEGKAGRLGIQLMAVTWRGPGKRERFYRAAGDMPATIVPPADQCAAETAHLCSSSGLSVPDEDIFSGDSRAFFTHLYGLERFGDLFTPRQLLVQVTFVQHVRQMYSTLLTAGLGAEKARAVTTYLALLADRLADWNSSLCKWSPTSESISDTFSRQALPMAWNFAEIYPLGDGSGNLHDALNRMVETIRVMAQLPGTAQVTRAPAHRCPLPDGSVDAVVTDPPYYDNVSYADLSDFFYVWLKRCIGDLYPEHLSSHLTPKKWEAIANASRHEGDGAAAQAFYQDIIRRSLEEAHRVLKPAAPLVLVYVHKTTAGWAAVVAALRSAGFVVTEAWPISTESKGRVRAQNSAALASSIFIVARKRSLVVTGNYARDVLPDLKRIVRERVATLSAAGISGADLVIATVGGGLRAYTRFSQVEQANGREMDASTFLDEVQREALTAILEHVVGLDQATVSAVDKVSQYYVLARYQYGTAKVDFDEANVLARGVGVELDGSGSLTSGTAPLLVKEKNVVQLQDYRQRGAARDLGCPNGSSAPLIDVLQRLLWLNDYQPGAVPAFLTEAWPDVEQLRLVAESLAGKGLVGGSGSGAVRGERTEEQKAIGRLLPAWKRVVEEQVQGRLL
jgi:putative DNA methylase